MVMQKTPITFDTLQQIREHVFVGNHFSDAHAISAVENFISDRVNNTLKIRAEAKRILCDRAFGLPFPADMSNADVLRG